MPREEERVHYHSTDENAPRAHDAEVTVHESERHVGTNVIPRWDTGLTLLEITPENRHLSGFSARHPGIASGKQTLD